jgi:hypothetical protein
MPGNTVYVGRGSKWGNPFKIGDKLSEVDPEFLTIALLSKEESDAGEITRDIAIDLFQDWIYYSQDSEAIWMRENIKLLKGKSLACWCAAGENCHADYLLKIANV